MESLQEKLIKQDKEVVFFSKGTTQNEPYEYYFKSPLEQLFEGNEDQQSKQKVQNTYNNPIKLQASKSLIEIPKEESSISSEDEIEDQSLQNKTRKFKKTLKELKQNRKESLNNYAILSIQNSNPFIQQQDINEESMSDSEDIDYQKHSKMYDAKYPNYSPCLPPIQSQMQQRKPIISLNIPQRNIIMTKNQIKLQIPKIFQLPELRYIELPEDRKLFLYNPVAKGKVLKLTIKRNKKGFKKMWPEYRCYFTENMENQIMYARKKPQVTSTFYYIGLNSKAKNLKSPLNLGRLRGNFMGTVYDLYDNGLNPKKKEANESNVRAQFGTILYKSQLFQELNPREIYFIIHKFNDYESILEQKPKNKSEEIYQKHKNNQIEGYQLFCNKSPEYDEKLQGYMLDFGDRVKIPDIKNCQIVRSGAEQEVYLQFGRWGEHTFNLDIKYPFSPFQGFAMALSTIDYKLAVE